MPLSDQMVLAFDPAKYSPEEAVVSMKFPSIELGRDVECVLSKELQDGT